MRQLDDPHLPTPEFRRRLELEIVRTLRAEAAAQRGPRFRLPRAGLRTAAMIFVSIGFGVAAGAGSAQVRDGQQRGRLLEVQRAEMALEALRLELAQAQAEEARRQAAVGVAGRESVLAAEADLRAMEANLARTRLDMAEIEATARPVRDDLAAPAVGGRDFVRERLDLELTVAQHRLVRVEEALALLQDRVRVGAIRKEALAGVRMDLEEARAELERLAARRQIREEFLRERLPVEEVARRVERTELAVQSRVLEQRRALVEVRLAEIQKRVDTGTAHEVELLRARLEEAELRVEMEALRAHLRALEEQ
jgi:outer membrane protein TolC